MEIYCAEARKLPASLSDFSATDPPELIFRYGLAGMQKSKD